MLTVKQHELLKFINGRLAEQGVSPSFDEMREALDLKSKSGVHRLISALEERGFIRRLPNRARALEVLKMPETVSPPVAAAMAVRTVMPSAANDTIDIPLHGRIAAGTPIEALQGSESFSVPAALLDHRIAGDFESIMLAWAKQGSRYGKALCSLQRLDRRTRGDPPMQRDFDRVVGRCRDDGARGGSCGLHCCRTDLRNLEDFKRPRSVREPPDKFAFLERRNEPVNAGLRLEVERLPHLIEAWADARLPEAILDEHEQFMLLGGEHRYVLRSERTKNI